MGRIINDTKQMYMIFDNTLKKKSLEDNLYFTLMDLLCNFASSSDSIMANGYSAMLTGNIDYKQRTDEFQYTNMLNEKDKLFKQLRWLDRIDPEWFEFWESDGSEDNRKYMDFDNWWKQFEELKQLLREHYDTLSQPRAFCYN